MVLIIFLKQIDCLHVCVCVRVLILENIKDIASVASVKNRLGHSDMTEHAGTLP